MSITALPTSPTRQMDAATYVAAFNAWIAAMPQFIADCNATAAGMVTTALGTAYALPYTFSTTTTDADPGAGLLRLSASPQNTATVIRMDLTGADTQDYTSVIDTFDDSGSTVKGVLRLVKQTDSTKWILFSVTSIASPSGYRNITVVPIAWSSASPFSNSDPLLISFSRTGDVGTSGTLALRSASTASDTAPTPNAGTTDIYLITAQAASATFGVPTGSPSDGQGLLIRIKDNGTARSLAWNAIYRAGSDLALPATTVLSKVLYIGFRYNAADTKWDLVSVLNNI